MSHAVLGRLSRYAARHRLHRWLPLGGSRPVVSLTFDDVPASAARTGARLLQARDCAGTFYVAGALTAGCEAGRPTHTLDDLLALRAAGHEIGSHGWGHVDYASLSRAGILDDLARNRDFLHEHLGEHEIASFAYPYGRYGLRAKRLVGAFHASARILGGGLHRGRADLNLLGSHRFYGEGRRPAAWRRLLAAMGPGDWLILNTHEVEPDHGPYGCAPTELAEFIDAALGAGCLVLPIGEAISRWRRFS